METDRLEEEKRRGISIALGFAHLALPGATADLIDMPGHERFVRTMISGATGIDAVLLVVSAAEGIKPQTVEHVDIAGLLGVRQAIVAVTQGRPRAAGPGRGGGPGGRSARRGPPAWSQDRRADLRRPALGLDACGRDRRGTARRRAAGRCGFPYLPIDRAFSLAGHGTVVTGTLRRGGMAAGGELVAIPSGGTVRVRGLQVHGAAGHAATPGQRVAVNLRGTELAAVPRGSALTSGAARAVGLAVGPAPLGGRPLRRSPTGPGCACCSARRRWTPPAPARPRRAAARRHRLAQLHCAVAGRRASPRAVHPAPALARAHGRRWPRAGSRHDPPAPPGTRRAGPARRPGHRSPGRIVVAEVERAEGGRASASPASPGSPALAPAQAAAMLQGGPVILLRGPGTP